MTPQDYYEVGGWVLVAALMAGLLWVAAHMAAIEDEEHNLNK